MGWGGLRTLSVPPSSSGHLLLPFTLRSLISVASTTAVGWFPSERKVTKPFSPTPAWLPPQGARKLPRGPGQPGLGSVEKRQHQNQLCCLDNGSCPRHPRHPQEQLLSVGEGFHGGGPKGYTRLREEQGLAGPFSFVLSTLGLCSCLALFDRWDQEHGWGGQHGLESPAQGRPESSGGGKERLESPSGAQLSLGSLPLACREA